MRLFLNGSPHIVDQFLNQNPSLHGKLVSVWQDAELIIDWEPMQEGRLAGYGSAFVLYSDLSFHDSSQNPQALACNLLPGFMHMPLKEVGLASYHDEKWASVWQALDWKVQPVTNQVGLVTARVVSMIINEAYFTLESGTASREDIDVSMKKGTNYPYGPFEWAQLIGLVQVCRILDQLHARTKLDRYLVCELLRQEAGL
jgi:hypothetical protein